ncbi:MAG: excinuclease ABC subunit UvrA [Cyanobacteria bacterium P01_H01_bin.74]
MSSPAIEIQSARVNNLKNVSCKIPQQAFTVVTGPSGSGKSSLAFDTLFAEGQRRYLESFSAYARQFLARIEKPDVDQILNILPAIALQQKNGIKNARSTVGTATDIYEFLRLLYGNVGQFFCPTCNTQVTAYDAREIEQQIQGLSVGSKLILLAPVASQKNKLLTSDIDDFIKQGFFRVFVDNTITELAPYWQAIQDNIVEQPEQLDIVVDRYIVKNKPIDKRLFESINNALMLSHGLLDIIQLPGPKADPEKNATENPRSRFQTQFSCRQCQSVFEPLSPQLFSFNSPIGACSTCEGYGRIIGIDLDKIIPNKGLSLKDGAVHPFTRPAYNDVMDDLISEARARKISVTTPWQDLKESDKRFVIEGGGRYEGIRGFFDWMETKKYKVHIRVMLSRYRGYYPCTTCDGSRLKSAALAVQLNGLTIFEVCNKPLTDVLEFLKALPETLSEQKKAIATPLLEELTGRVSYLISMGLGYLTLQRQFRTLSNGEAQRINLARALGSGLTETLYVLDEPTVGLHARDTNRLVTLLKELSKKGNTVLVVEHDPDVMLAADYIIDMGPSGGQDGGRIVFEGRPADLKTIDYSVTARYLFKDTKSQGRFLSEADSVNKQVQAKLTSKAPTDHWFEIREAIGNNLKNISVRFPVKQLVCVTGVSGSGKSTLVKQTLFAHHEHLNGRSLELDAMPHGGIIGLDQFKEILLVDQSPLGRSVRSNAVTYTKAYDEIRKVFASTRKAVSMGITASAFSFNTTGGRCEPCEGLGTLTIDMQFMADVTMECPQCFGRRFNESVLAIEYNGKPIDKVLDLTVEQAIDFFADSPKIIQKLHPLMAIGLGYIRLGQSTSTLSGGETQRLKLASYLPANNLPMAPQSKQGSKTKKSKTENPKKANKIRQEPILFLFDEPTTGLHLSDIERLVQALRNLIAAGHSVVVIEHNIDFIAQSDYCIELGPEGGNSGGHVVASGSISVLQGLSDTSPTGYYLNQRVKKLAISEKDDEKQCTVKEKSVPVKPCHQ